MTRALTFSLSNLAARSPGDLIVGVSLNANNEPQDEEVFNEEEMLREEVREEQNGGRITR